MHPSKRDKAYCLMIATNCCPGIIAIVERMFKFLKKTETITIHEWHDQKWYVEVIDQTMLAAARQATPDAKRRDDTICATRFMLSVDVKKDCVLWNSEGGNCMIRGRRWKNFAQSVNGFGTSNILTEFHHYK